MNIDTERRQHRPTLQQVDVGVLRIERTHCSGPLLDPIDVPVVGKTSFIVQLQPFRRHKIWRSRRLVYEGGHHTGALSMTNLEEEWKCHHLSAFDNVRLQVAHHELEELAARAGAGRGFALRNPGGKVDHTMYLLASSIATALDGEGALNRLFLGHVTSAMMAHLVAVYGNGLRRGRPAPGLSPRHERIALEYMREHVTENIAVEDIARACGLSSGHFSKAFLQSTGLTPHQWMLRVRVDLAKALLRHGFDIAAVAISCGFSDQSHFSRVFRKITGFSPAQWRDR